MKNLILLLFVFTANQNVAQLKLHTFEEAEKLSLENPKPFFIFIHASWCKYCKMMQHSTFKNEEVITQLNEKFYFIPFDAEDKNDITFNNHLFKFKPKGSNSGVHELAESLSNQIYPTITILNPDYTVLAQIESFVNAKQLLNYLSK